MPRARRLGSMSLSARLPFRTGALIDVAFRASAKTSHRAASAPRARVPFPSGVMLEVMLPVSVVFPEVVSVVVLRPPLVVTASVKVRAPAIESDRRKLLLASVRLLSATPYTSATPRRTNRARLSAVLVRSTPAPRAAPT